MSEEITCLLPQWVIKRANTWVVHKYTGEITIAFKDGGVRNIKKGEVEFPPPKTKKEALKI